MLESLYEAFMEGFMMFNGSSGGLWLLYMNASFCDFSTHMQWIELILIPNE